VLLVVSLVACASAHTGNVPVGAPVNSAPDAQLESLYWSRLDSARARYTGADVRFVTAMIGHHAQALAVAQMAPASDASSSVRVLAARIINQQQDEITLMQQWLRDREQPVPDVHVSASTVMLHDPGQDVRALGMLTHEQLGELESARGAGFDRLFLRNMIVHHRGAVAMVRGLVATDGAAQDPALFKLASDIQADQLTEIAAMERLLATLADTKKTR
jgi:uncharacterized protein (DUF305 family)